MPLGSLTAFQRSVTLARQESAPLGEIKDGAGGAVVSGGVVGVRVGLGGLVTVMVVCRVVRRPESKTGPGPA